TEMDRVTQQNASLVEESASAAAALEEQASRLSHAVSVFKVRQDQVSRPTALKTPVLSKPVSTKLAAAPAAGDSNWETF
ncbi:MAG: methyl-accepting chemotaxis protein II, partial [Pantoea sp.]|nr:methyl-accepting chemotaxis protein II [Pantoea sp.]